MDQAELEAKLQAVGDALQELGEIAVQVNATIEKAQAAFDDLRTKLDAGETEGA